MGAPSIIGSKHIACRIDGPGKTTGEIGSDVGRDPDGMELLRRYIRADLGGTNSPPKRDEDRTANADAVKADVQATRAKTPQVRERIAGARADLGMP